MNICTSDLLTDFSVESLIAEITFRPKHDGTETLILSGSNRGEPAAAPLTDDADPTAAKRFYIKNWNKKPHIFFLLALFDCCQKYIWRETVAEKLIMIQAS